MISRGEVGARNRRCKTKEFQISLKFLFFYSLYTYTYTYTLKELWPMLGIASFGSRFHKWGNKGWLLNSKKISLSSSKQWTFQPLLGISGHLVKYWHLFSSAILSSSCLLDLPSGWSMRFVTDVHSQGGWGCAHTCKAMFRAMEAMCGKLVKPHPC